MNRSVPVVWRSDTCVQFGVDDPILLDGACSADQELLELVRNGVEESEFLSVAATLGMSFKRASALISLLTETGVLVPESERAPEITPEMDALAQCVQANPTDLHSVMRAQEVILVGPFRSDLCDAFCAAGVRARSIDQLEIDLLAYDSTVVLSSVWVPDLYAASELMEAGIAHQHLVIGQAQATVSHVIVPGLTPCSGCWVGELSDCDDGWLRAWTAIRAQCPSPVRVDPVLTHIAMYQAVNMVRNYQCQAGTGERTVVSLPSGDIRRDKISKHPRCACLDDPLYAQHAEIPLNS